MGTGLNEVIKLTWAQRELYEISFVSRATTRATMSISGIYPSIGVLINHHIIVLGRGREISSLKYGKVSVYGEDKKIESQDMSYWTKEWWHWILSIPRAVNPSNDRTGEFSGIYQVTNVFNLGGGPSGPASSKWRLGEDRSHAQCWSRKECRF